MKPAVLLHVPWVFDMLGGVDVVVDRLRQGLERDGRYRPLIGVHDWDGSHPNHVDGNGRVFVPLALPRAASELDTLASLRLRASLFRRAFGLAAILRHHGVVAFHAHFPSLHLHSVALAKRWGLWRGKLILSFHGSDVTQVEPHRREWKFLASQTDAVTACSRGLAAEVSGTGLFPSRSVAVAYNGIDVDAFVAEARGAQWPELAGRQYLLGIGTFIALKAQDELIAAFAEVARAFPDLALVLAGGRGDSAWMASLEAMAKSRGLGDRVRFVVDVPHERVASLIAGARALVHASRREGFSLVLLEAGALGVPIVATRVGGIPELTGDSGALLYAPGDRPALVAAMRRLLTDSALSGALTEHMRARVAERFSDRAMTAAYLSSYAE